MKPLEERIVSSKEVFRGRLLRLNVEEVVLADGAPARREVVYHPGAVAVVTLTDSGTVVLVRQFRLPTGRALLEIPAGTLSPNELPEDCARRELAEEIGLQPDADGLERLCSIYLAPGYSSELIHLFVARNLAPAEAEPDHDERLERVEMPFSDALEMIKRGEIQDAKSIVGLLLVKSRESNLQST